MSCDCHVITVSGKKDEVTKPPQTKTGKRKHQEPTAVFYANGDAPLPAKKLKRMVAN